MQKPTTPKYVFALQQELKALIFSNQAKTPGEIDKPTIIVAGWSLLCQSREEVGKDARNIAALLTD